MKKLLVYAIVSTILLFVGISFYSPTKHTTKPTIAQNEALETYDYIITGKDSKGYYGDSLNDDTKIFLVEANLKGIKLNKNDCVRVTFPKNDYENITRVEKLSGQ